MEPVVECANTLLSPLTFYFHENILMAVQKDSIITSSMKSQ